MLPWVPSQSPALQITTLLLGPQPLCCTQLLPFSQDAFQASKVPKQCAGLQIKRSWEHSYITAECGPQYQPWEIRNRRTEAHVSTFRKCHFSMSCTCPVPTDRVKDMNCPETVRAAKLSKWECLESICAIWTSEIGGRLRITYPPNTLCVSLALVGRSGGAGGIAQCAG